MLVQFRTASTICVDDYVDLIPGTYADHTEAIQAACDDAVAGDTVRFGSCDGSCANCTPATYIVGRTSDPYNPNCPHGVTYDGQGSTIKLDDRDTASWDQWRWRKCLAVTGEYSSTATTIQDFVIDGNRDNQNPGVEESKQRGIYVQSDSVAPLQDVVIQDVEAKNGTWGCISQSNGTNVYSLRTSSDYCHHGWQLSANNVQATIDEHVSGETAADDYAIKGESYTGPVQLTIQDSTIYDCETAGIAWDDDYGGALTIEDTAVTCQSGSARNGLIAMLSGGSLYITGSEFTGSANYQTIVVGQPGRGGVTLEDVTIAGGYLHLGTPTSYGPSTIRLDTVTWSGDGWDTASGDYAIRSEENDNAKPLRTVEIYDCDGGADNELFAYVRGGHTVIDAATAATYDAYGAPQEDQVVRCHGESGTTCRVFYELEALESAYWCGIDVAGDCDL